MTNEQRGTIDKLTNGEKMDFSTLVRTFKKEGIENFAVVRKEYVDTVLSLIKEQEKQIDLMAEIFYKKFKAELLLEYGFESEEQLKQYFENKAKKE